jgi:hypothetical protein
MLIAYRTCHRTLQSLFYGVQKTLVLARLSTVIEIFNILIYYASTGTMNSLKLFARRLPQITASAARRDIHRASNTFAPPPAKRVFWSSGRVLLFTTFTASLTYLLGINDVTRSVKPWNTTLRVPSYGTKRDMEKVFYLQ